MDPKMLEDSFNTFDTDRSGFITKTEVTTFSINTMSNRLFLYVNQLSEA